MLRVRNRKTLRNLAIKSFGANKLRNTFAIFAIMLTTVLFTSLFTIGSSLAESIQASTMRQVGGSNHGTFKDLSQQEYEKLKTHKSIKESGYSVVLGFGENKELIKRPSEIRYTSGEWQAKSFFAYPTTGRLPEGSNELATDTLVLEKLGVPCKLGEKVTLEYSLGNNKVTDTFTLVGFWKGDKVTPASEIWVAPSYVKDKLEDYHPIYKNDTTGKINLDVKFSNSIQIEKKMLKVISDSGYEKKDIYYGVNWAYLGNKEGVDVATVLGGAGVILLIIFCGYLIISNIFYISIAKDIQYYGLLKAVGTTSRQIKAMIKKQAWLLCLIGTPIGLLFGFLVGKQLTPIVLSILNTEVMKISINPLIFLGASIFSIITVFMSTSKPARIASKVSPIEAIRKTDNTSNVKRKFKKSNRTSLFKMAKENVLRNKKKMVLVTISLSLSLIILNCTYSIISSFDMDKFLKESIVNDFTIADAAYFNVYVQYKGQDTLSNEFLEELYSQKGVQNKGNIYLSETTCPMDYKIKAAINHVSSTPDSGSNLGGAASQTLKEKTLMGHIYGLDASVLNNLNLYQGSIDQEKFMSGDYVIVAPMDTEGKEVYYKIGDSVRIPYANGKTKEYKVLATADIPFCISVRHSHPFEVNYFIPSGEFLKENGTIAPMVTSYNVDKKYIPQMDRYLENYCKNVNPDLQYQSKKTFQSEFEGLKQTYLSVGLVVSGIVAFIGVMNFINTIVTSIITRRRELAMLQSIGMTKKQLKKMLIYEGLIYIVFTALLMMTLGSLFGYYAIKAFMGNMWFLTTSFTIKPSILCLPILVVFAVIVPLVSYRFTNKKSIVEQLRLEE